VYWEFSHNPAIQLTRSVREFQEMTPFRPIIPAGPAYKRGSWEPTPEDIIEFLNTVKSLNLSAATFWEWATVRKEPMQAVWTAIRDYPWGSGPVPSDIVERYIYSLNEHDAQKVVNLYAPTAAHVTATQTKNGHEAIRAWYQSLFSHVLPNATFTLSGYSGGGNSRHFTWTATSERGTVHNGNDVFGLLDGQVVYHYTFFTVTPN
jgi:hypothetical protein